jgi:integrase
MALTDTQLRGLKPVEKPKKFADGGGLYLLLTPSGGRLWRLDYRHGGLRKTLALGSYPAVSLKEVRTRRAEAKLQLAQGTDPAAHKQAAKVEAQARLENTFERISEQWLERFKTAWSPSVKRAKKSRFERYVLPFIGGKQIDEITVADVRSVLQRILDIGSPTAARSALQDVSNVFRFGIARGLVQFDIAAGLRGSLPPIRTRHFPAITEPRRVGELMRAICTFPGNKLIGLALRMVALTMVRSNELRKAEWSEIDFENSVWRIPAGRMKKGRAHIVPLSRQALELFREVRRFTGHCEHVFPALQSNGKRDACLSDASLLAGLRRLGYGPDEMTCHGFRSMASTLLNERGYRSDLIERQLAHCESSDVRAAYNHAEYLTERRAMLQEYADFLDVLRDAVPSQ